MTFYRKVIHLEIQLLVKWLSFLKKEIINKVFINAFLHLRNFKNLTFKIY